MTYYSTVFFALALSVASLQQERDTHGYSLKVSPDGRVEMTVFDKDADGKTNERTYRAESMEQLVKEHPDLAKQYHLDRLASPRGSDSPGNDAAEDWKLRFGERWFWDKGDGEEFESWLKDAPKSLQSDELARWMAEQRELFERFRRLQPAPDGDGPKLGVLIAPLGDTQAKKLGLEKSRGVVIAAVQKGSVADQAGLKRDDVVLQINGRSVTDPKFFREEVLKSSSGFDLLVFRDGKRETIKVALK